MVLDIRSESKKMGKGVLLLNGKLTIYSVRSLKNVIDEELEKIKALEMDFSGITDIDTAGFQLCIYAYREASRAGKSVHITKPSQSVRTLFGLYHTHFE